MNPLSQNSSKSLPFSTKGTAYILGTTTIITTPWGY